MHRKAASVYSLPQITIYTKKKTIWWSKSKKIASVAKKTHFFSAKCLYLLLEFSPSACFNLELKFLPTCWLCGIIFSHLAPFRFGYFRNYIRSCKTYDYRIDSQNRRKGLIKRKSFTVRQIFRFLLNLRLIMCVCVLACVLVWCRWKWFTWASDSAIGDK